MTKTNALESLVIASFVRGLSVRDVEAALTEALGDQAAISKSTVSSVCQQIKDDYEAWAQRRLDGITLDYLFLDASFFNFITTLAVPWFVLVTTGSAARAGLTSAAMAIGGVLTAALGRTTHVSTQRTVKSLPDGQ